MAGKQDEAKHWLKRAADSLSASEVLISEGLLDDAISRAYYAMFYAAKALLIRDEVAVGAKHAAVGAALLAEAAINASPSSRL